jgi:prevent-host-death family protein
MPTVALTGAKAGLSNLVDEANNGAFVTITRHGKPAAVLVSVEAADIARKALEKERPGLAAYLQTFPGGEFDRGAAAYRRPAGQPNPGA